MCVEVLVKTAVGLQRALQISRRGCRRTARERGPGAVAQRADHPGLAHRLGLLQVRGNRLGRSAGLQQQLTTAALQQRGLTDPELREDRLADDRVDEPQRPFRGEHISDNQRVGGTLRHRRCKLCQRSRKRKRRCVEHGDGVRERLRIATGNSEADQNRPSDARRTEFPDQLRAVHGGRYPLRTARRDELQQKVRVPVGDLAARSQELRIASRAQL
jgi:hypothetical protein